MGGRLHFSVDRVVLFTLVAGCLLPVIIQGAKNKAQEEQCITSNNKRGYCKTREQCPGVELLDLRIGGCSNTKLYCCPIPTESHLVDMTGQFTECDGNRGYCVKSNACPVRTFRLRTNRCPSFEEVCCPKSAYLEKTTKKPAVELVSPIDSSTIDTSTVAAIISTTTYSNVENSVTRDTYQDVTVNEKTTTVVPTSDPYVTDHKSSSSSPAVTIDTTTVATTSEYPSLRPSTEQFTSSTSSSSVGYHSSDEIASNNGILDETEMNLNQTDPKVDISEENFFMENNSTFSQTNETIPSNIDSTNDIIYDLKDEFKQENFSFQQCGQLNLNGVVKTTLNEESRAEYGEFPWMVALFQLPQKRYCCNGALINERMILTTAHCVDRCGGQSANILTRLGEWNMSSSLEMPITRQEIRVKKFYKHPAYFLSSLINNIALLKLSDPVQYGPTVQPVCLPSPDYILRGGESIIVTGWGKMMKQNPMSEQILKRMDLIPKESSICQSEFKKSGITRFSLDRSFVCVTTNGEDVERPCDGDAGGPAVVEIPSSDNRYYLHGLVSFGYTCDQRQKRLNVLTKVVDFEDWINGIIRRK